MTLPTAIASGADATAPTVVAPVRAGLVTGVLAAVLVFVTYLVAPLPTRVLGLVGGPATELARHGGMRLAWTGPDGVAHVDETPGVGPAEVERAARIAATGGVRFHRVVTAAAMIELAGHFGGTLDEPTEATPHIAADTWSGESGGHGSDYYVHGTDRAQIEALFERARAGGWALPPGTRIAYEQVAAAPGRPAHLRSYVIETAPALDGRAIASAESSYDANTNRPVVLLAFTREGATRFGDLTASMVGQKLATVLGGEVVSAPIINGPIRGGRASITMGGNDTRTQERDRDALLAALRTTPLPDGATLTSATYVPPAGAQLQVWLARGVLALLAGALLGVVAWAVVRRTQPVVRAPARLSGAVAWQRLAVLLLAPAIVIATSAIVAPGIDGAALVEVAGSDAQARLGMLGLAPILSAYLLVELVATLVPRWRRRRHAGAAARLPFDLAVGALALVLSVLQAWFVAVYLDRLDVAPVGLARLGFLASIAATTAAFMGVAWVIRRYGAGNGYGVLLATGLGVQAYHLLATPAVVGPWAPPPVPAGYIVVALVTALVIGLAIAAVLRWRIAGPGEVPLRVPASGIAPIGEAEGLLALIFVALGALPVDGLTRALDDLRIWMHDLPRGVALALVAVFALVWSWAVARPRALAPFAARAGVAPPSQASWRAAVVLTAAILVAIAAANAFVASVVPGAVFPALGVLVVAATVRDVVDDLSGRRGDLVRAWSLHGAPHAELAAQVLAADGIPFHLAGANLRALLAWFGPFAPVDVWVPREHAARAHDRLANVFAAQ